MRSTSVASGIVLAVSVFVTALVACGGSDDPAQGASSTGGTGGAAAAGAGGSSNGGSSNAGSAGAAGGVQKGGAAGASGAAGATAGAGGAAAGAGGTTAGAGGAAAGAAGAGGAAAGAGGTAAGAGGAAAGAGGTAAGAGGTAAGTGGTAAGAGGTAAGAGGTAAGAAGASGSGGSAGGTAGTGGAPSGFVAKSAVHVVKDTLGTPGNLSQHITFIGISDHSSDQCALAQVGDKIASSQSLSLIVIVYGTNTQVEPLVPGTYLPGGGGTLGNSGGVNIGISTNDASCVKSQSKTYDKPENGSVTITAVSTAEVSGSFDLLLDGLSYTGTFVAPLCVQMQPPPMPTNQCLPASTP